MRIDDIEEILRDEPEIWDDEPRKNIFGYPTRPLYRELGARLQEWMLTGYFDYKTSLPINKTYFKYLSNNDNELSRISILITMYLIHSSACPSKALPKYFMLDEVEENWKRYVYTCVFIHEKLFFKYT